MGVPAVAAAGFAPARGRLAGRVGRLRRGPLRPGGGTVSGRRKPGPQTFTGKPTSGTITVRPPSPVRHENGWRARPRRALMETGPRSGIPSVCIPCPWATVSLVPSRHPGRSHPVVPDRAGLRNSGRRHSHHTTRMIRRNVSISPPRFSRRSYGPQPHASPLCLVHAPTARSANARPRSNSVFRRLFSALGDRPPFRQTLARSPARSSWCRSALPRRPASSSMMVGNHPALWRPGRIQASSDRAT